MAELAQALVWIATTQLLLQGSAMILAEHGETQPDHELVEFARQIQRASARWRGWPVKLPERATGLAIVYIDWRGPELTLSADGNNMNAEGDPCRTAAELYDWLRRDWDELGLTREEADRLMAEALKAVSDAGREPGPYTRGTCSSCETQRPVRRDGKIRAHRHEWFGWVPGKGRSEARRRHVTPCPGSGRKPLL